MGTTGKKVTRKTEKWNDPLIPPSRVIKEKRIHNVMNAITHISDSGLNGCYY